MTKVKETVNTYKRVQDNISDKVGEKFTLSEIDLIVRTYFEELGNNLKENQNKTYTITNFGSFTSTIRKGGYKEDFLGIKGGKRYYQDEYLMIKFKKSNNLRKDFEK